MQDRFGGKSGHSRLGQFESGQLNLGQSAFIRFSPKKILKTFWWIWANMFGHEFLSDLGHSGEPEGRVGGPKQAKVGAEGWEPEGWEAQHFAFLFHLPRKFRSFLLSGRSSRGTVAAVRGHGPLDVRSWASLVSSCASPGGWFGGC